MKYLTLNIIEQSDLFYIIQIYKNIAIKIIDWDTHPTKATHIFSLLLVALCFLFFENLQYCNCETRSKDHECAYYLCWTKFSVKYCWLEDESHYYLEEEHNSKLTCFLVSCSKWVKKLCYDTWYCREHQINR